MKITDEEDEARIQERVKLYDFYKKAVQEEAMNSRHIELLNTEKKEIDDFLDKKGHHLIVPPEELRKIFEKLLKKQFNGVYFISLFMQDDNVISKRTTVFAVMHMYLRCSVGRFNNWGVHVEFNRDTYKFEVVGVWPTD
jgi:hypothetical protein